ncbi:MAG: hypothetical protein JNN05_01960, partial [Candidatus Omnitrophica bacterium]|nr:hypothetical protein [Candidatus Omnitrophota bacterium]
MAKIRQFNTLLFLYVLLICGHVLAQEAVSQKEEAVEPASSLENSKKTIQELNAKVANLEQQVFNLLSGDFDAEAKKILDKQFENEHKKLIDEASALRSKVKSLTDNLDSKSKSIEKLADQKQILIKQVRKYKSEYARLTSELKISQSKMEHSDQLSLNKSQASEEQSRSKMENLSKQLEVVSGEKDQKSAALDRLNQKNAQLTEDLYVSTVELRKAKDRIAQLQKRSNETGSKESSFGNQQSSEVVDLNQKIQQLTKQLEESQKQNELLQKNLAFSNNKTQEGLPFPDQSGNLLDKKLADLESQIQLQERFSQE